MNQSKTDLHPCPGKSINGIKTYVKNMAKSASTPMCILHCGATDCTSRDRKNTREILEDFDDLIAAAKEQLFQLIPSECEFYHL